MYLSPGKCREMGVFLLACAFHGPAEGIPLTLSHPESDIRRIIIPAGRLTLEDLPVGLLMVPFALNYYPAETRKHPWLYDFGTRSLPALHLSVLAALLVACKLMPNRHERCRERVVTSVRRISFAALETTELV